MKKGVNVIVLFVMLSAFMLALVVIPIGIRQFNYLAYGKCVSDTLRDIDILLEQFKKAKSKTGFAVPVRVTDCIEEVVFTNKNWRVMAKGMKEVKCKDDADAHVLIFKRDISFWNAVKSGREKVVAKLVAPDVVCRNIYDMYFNTLPGDRLEGPKKDSEIYYCLKFQVNPSQKYVDIYSWDVVSSKDKCVL